jgi:hypothetical protein
MKEALRELFLVFLFLLIFWAFMVGCLLFDITS